MPAENRIDRENHLVRVRLVGRITPEDLEQGFEARAREPGYEPGMDLLLDCTDATIEFGRTGVQRILRYFASRRAERGSGFRVALVGNSDLNFGMARMYETLSGLEAGYPEEARAFRDAEEARRWLLEPREVEVGEGGG